MKTAILAAAGVLALTAAACAPPYAGKSQWGGALKPVSRLDCPDSKGALTRISASPDGQSCAYTGRDGAEVNVSLIKLSGSPDTALDGVEAELKALTPAPEPKTETPPTAPTPPTPPSGAPTRSADNVNISLPGVRIHAGEDKANISVGGLHIDADGENDSVHMHGGHGLVDHRGQFTLDATDAGAIIRSKGGGPGVRASLILASDHPGPQGWQVVGYEARGPRAGPLVVATIKLKSEDHDNVFQDAKAIVRKCAGG